MSDKKSLLLSLVLGSLIAIASCGDPSADDIAQNASAIQSSSDTAGQYYRQSFGLLVPGGSPVIDSNVHGTTSSYVGGCSPWMTIGVVDNARVQCGLCMSWRTGSPNFPGGNQPYVPRSYGGGITHGGSVGSGWSWCTVDGAYQSMPDNAVEWWETTQSPAVDSAHTSANVAAWVVFRIPGWSATTSAVWHTSN